MSGRLDIRDHAALAAEGWRLGGQLCGACRTYHRLWGTLRLAGIVNGMRADTEVLTPLLAELLTDGAQVLLAGAADPGQLELLIDAAAGRRLKVTVADLCPTPLALFRRLDLPPSVELRTAELDLTRLEDVAAYDLILSHGMLPFVGAQGQARLLQRLRRALKPEGRLIVILRTSPPTPPGQEHALQAAWLRRARALLAQTPLPAPEAEMEPLLRAFAVERLSRAAPTDDPAELERGLVDGGVEVERRIRSGQSTTLEIAGRLHARQGHVFVCR